MKRLRASQTVNYCLFLFLCLIISTCRSSVLYPRDTETREVKTLDGIWNFRLSSEQDDLKNLFTKFDSVMSDSDTVISMPVPASYNDITQERMYRDYVGVVLYERNFFVPTSWQNDQRRIVLRFGSVCYAAEVWINGQSVTSHEIGHLPFEVDITEFVQSSGENLITVAVNNTLNETSIPQGSISQLNLGNNKTIIQQSYTFDFFNYAGIDRSVYLYTTPKSFYVEDLSVNNTVSDDLKSAAVQYAIEYKANNTSTLVKCNVSLLDKENTVVATSSGLTGVLNVANPKLWWPYLMDPDPGYLYTLKVELSADGSDVKDIYRQSIGIRSLFWDNSNFLINGKPIYIRGVGRHEDSDIRGKGLDLPLIVKDYNLIKWLGINAYRTSHYPYSEEIMDFADKEGIMIIDECPSVNTDLFSDQLKENHKRSLTELIKRDKHRPSVIIWSVANEPRTQVQASGPYFKDIVDHVKTLDTTRPTTIAQSSTPDQDFSAAYLDIVSFNRYNSWYSDTGKTDIITQYVIAEAEAWRNKHNKPILMTEYGADTLAGLHNSPEFVWSEEYQQIAFQEHFKAFDILRQRGYFIGEMIWNFADFMTAQTITRVGGNKKGLLTRQRQPKTAAFLVRKRYFRLAQELNNATLPDDLYEYFSQSNP